MRRSMRRCAGLLVVLPGLFLPRFALAFIPGLLLPQLALFPLLSPRFFPPFLLLLLLPLRFRLSLPLFLQSFLLLGLLARTFLFLGLSLRLPLLALFLSLLPLLFELSLLLGFRRRFLGGLFRLPPSFLFLFGLSLELLLVFSLLSFASFLGIARFVPILLFQQFFDEFLLTLLSHLFPVRR